MARVELEPVELEEEDELGVDIPAEIIGRSPGQIFWRRFRKDRFAFVGIIIIIFIVAMAFLAPVFAKVLHHPPDQPYVDEMTHSLAGNSANGSLIVTGIVNGPTLHNPAGIFLFGADSTARDLFVRVMYGAQTSLYVALSATVLEVVMGVFFGILAGYYRGKVDTVISRACDIFFALPTLLLILGISAACGAQPPGQECAGGLLKPGRGLIIFLIGFFAWPYLARIIRGQVLSLREKEFVEASRSLGSSNTRIMMRDILPNVLAPIIVYSTLLIPTNILAEASLSYLGLGVPPSIPSWGNQIAEATSIYRIAPWTMIFPGIFLLLTTLAFNLVGDGLRDAFDPKTS
ncbi:MAG TPA: ABC transporter permease [Actinomycetota bacterium]|nr:ABC transporter permease [Actinomycetota bacterium]